MHKWCHSHFFTQKVIVLGKDNFLFFKRFFFQNSLNLNKKYSSIFEVLSSTQRTGCGKLLCISFMAIYFSL